MTKPTHRLLPPALLSQPACLAPPALHPPPRIALGPVLADTTSTRYCSPLRFGKNCQPATALSQPQRDPLCSPSSLPTPARYPSTPPREPRLPARLEPGQRRSHHRAPGKPGAPPPRLAPTQTWAGADQRGLPRFFQEVCQVPKDICRHSPRLFRVETPTASPRHPPSPSQRSCCSLSSAPRSKGAGANLRGKAVGTLDSTNRPAPLVGGFVTMPTQPSDN